MKTFFIFLATVVWACDFAHAQIVFNRAYDNDSTYDFGFAVIQTLDGGYLIGGETFSLGNYSDLLFVKTNYKGDIQWTKVIDTIPFDDGVEAMLQIKNGSYIVCGYAEIDTPYDAFLMKLDINGNLIRFQRYGGSDNDGADWIQQTPDGGFIIVGWTYSFSYGQADAYLIKTDSNGNMEWQKHFGGTNYDFPEAIVVCKDSGYAFAGYTKSYGGGLARVWLFKTNSIGDSLWQGTYAIGTDDGANDLKQTVDGGFAIGGFTKISGQYDAYIIKTDSVGTVEWEKSFGNSLYTDTFDSMTQLADGSFVIAGQRYDSSGTNVEGSLTKISVDGDTMLWSRNYTKFGGNNNDDYFYDMKPASDGGFIMTGMVTNLGVLTLQDMWLVKTDCMGNDSLWDSVNCPLGVGIERPFVNAQGDVVIYPNPFSDRTTVKFENPKNKRYRLVIYDLLGREMKFIETKENKIEIQRGNLVNGMYLYTISDGKEIIWRGKIIIQ